MLYLLIEIHNYSQLLKLDNENISGIYKQIIDKIKVCSRFTNTRGEYILGCLRNVSAEDPSRALECLWAVFTILKENIDKLIGYSILLEDYGEAKIEDVFKKMRGVLNTRGEMEGVWLGRKAAALLENLLEVKPDYGLFRVTVRKKIREKNLGSYRDFSERKEVAAHLFNSIEDNLNGERQGELILLHGPDYCGKWTNMETVLKKIQGNSLFDSWLVLDGTLPDSIYTHFFRNLPLDLIFESMTGTEKIVYKQYRYIIDYFRSNTDVKVFPDHLKSDLGVLLRLILSGFYRKMTSELLPAFLICSGLKEYSAADLDLLRSLIEDFLSIPDFFIILISPVVELPTALQHFPVKMIHIPAVSDEEINRFEKLFFPVDAVVPRYNDTDTAVQQNTIASLYHYYRVKEIGEERQLNSIEDEESLPPFFRPICDHFFALDTDYHDVYYIIGILDGLLDFDEILVMLGRLDLAKSIIRDVILKLIYTGYLIGETVLVPLYPFLIEMLEKHDQRKCKVLLSLTADYLIENDVMRSQSNLLRIYKILRRADRTEESIVSYYNLISDNLCRRDFEKAEYLLESENPLAIGGFKDNEGQMVEDIIKAGGIRSAILMRNYESAAVACESAPLHIPIDKGHQFSGNLLLQYCRCSLVCGNNDDALHQVKNAIILYQEKEDFSGICRANIDLGCILLTQEKLDEARDYFSIARVSATQLDNGYELVRSITYESIASYLSGNYSIAIESVDAGIARAEKVGMREYEVFLNFIKARIFFSLGDYSSAKEQFSFCLSLNRIYIIPDASAVFYKWLARSAIYLGEGDLGMRIFSDLEEDRESLFFQSEFYILRMDYGKALDLISRSIELPHDQVPLSTERIAWNSGFAHLEDIVFGREYGGRVLDNLLFSFRGFLNFNTGSRGREEYRALLRSGALSENDPYNYLYYFLYSMVLPDSGDEILEAGLTVLGKSVKTLQERMARIDNVAHRRFFIKENYWNKMLLERARKYNLTA
jgi:tetratricopeptide (TPR) repeat protein